MERVPYNEAISLATDSRKYCYPTSRKYRSSRLLLHCKARNVARRELLICAPSIGATQPMPLLFISRETLGPHRRCQNSIHSHCMMRISDPFKLTPTLVCARF